MKIKLSELRKLINEEISGRLIKRDRRDFEERNAKNVLNTIDRSPTPAARFDRPIIKKASSPTKKISLEYEIPNIDIDFTVSKDTHFGDFPFKLEISLNEYRALKNDTIDKFERVTDVEYDIIKHNMLIEINECILKIFKVHDLKYQNNREDFTGDQAVDMTRADVIYHYYESDSLDSIKIYFRDTNTLKTILKDVYYDSKNGIVD